MHWTMLIATKALAQTHGAPDGMLRIQGDPVVADGPLSSRAAMPLPLFLLGRVVVGLWVVQAAGNLPLRIPDAELLPTSFDVTPDNVVQPLSTCPPCEVKVFLYIVAGQPGEGV